MITLLVAILASVLFLAMVFLLIYVGRMPKTQTQRRMNQMIAEAEKERQEALKKARQKAKKEKRRQKSAVKRTVEAGVPDKRLKKR